jgi:hypothetical protein
MSNNQTELKPTIEVAWGSLFSIASGVDAITGNITGKGVSYSALIPATTTEVHMSNYFIASEEDLTKGFDGLLSGSLNIEGLKISESREFLKKVEYSELCISLVSRYQVLYSAYDEAQSYSLTADASAYMEKDPVGFRNQYGDYFIAGCKRGSELSAVYLCQATCEGDMNQFKVAIGGKIPDMFSADDSAAFTKTAQQYNITISTSVVMLGCNGVPPIEASTPLDVINLLSWFSANASGVNYQAKLMHYNTIAPGYPRTIDISPDEFIALDDFYMEIWNVEASYNACPVYYKNVYSSEYHSLITEVMANQSNLVTDTDLRNKYKQDADKLLNYLNIVLTRMVFYYNVKACIPSEPKNGDHHNGNDDKSWLYGYDKYDSPYVTIMQYCDEKKSDAKGCGDNSYHFNFGPDSSYIVVGWRITSHRDNNGYWAKSVDTILTTNQFRVHIESDFDRGYHWSCEVYYVDACNYHF